jgi:hypothetical protein
MAHVTSPYLKSGRLGDVIAAIQAMGASEDYYARSCDAWAPIISGQQRDGRYWKNVFDEHGEFFRQVIREQEAADERYALIWRMAFKDEPGKSPRRRVLAPEEIKLLCDMAVNMHARALEAQRWWIPPALAFVGSLLGAIIAFAAAGLFKGVTH